MISVVLLSLLLGTAPDDGAQAPLQSLDSPPVADESPTAWSCTVDTLRAGKECVFEAELTPSRPNPEQASQNIRLVRELGRTLCSEAARPRSADARPDSALSSSCERKYTSATERCGLEGAVSIIDAQGRFAPAARACYRALAMVLQETQTQAAMASSAGSK